MTVSHIHHVMLLTILVVGVIDAALGQHPPSTIAESRCWDTANFVVHCSTFIHSLDRNQHAPNKKCCSYAQKIDIAVFCKKFVTGEIFSSDKVVHVARICGNPLPKGSKC
ncbi:hypothetical protein PHJA_000156600 [Phtheirospermum japonicum]|uniref:Bifunctional inhibitor/plant lipid transfer protein/seed storage helical domain-containing protein n=1 Tax=Phtheirospermum japonicum TaxID=374723 RepID=A0A830B3J8_9LAMI|nr:hypothetical protein PHJA_000156600 [Phtheirospermum japonicum]